MSIAVEIIDRVRRGMLFPVLPSMPGDPAIRVLLAGARVWSVLNSAEGDAAWEQRVGELKADLEVFVTQARLGPRYLFLLSPAADAVWEIRSVRPEPSIRVLGLFALKDVFIATDIALRGDLAGWQSRDWKQVKRNARAGWRRLFASYEPVATTNVHDVVTGAVDGRYVR